MGTDTLNFRKATRADAEAIIALVESAYRGESSRKGWTTEADLLDGQRIDRQLLLELIERADARVLMAEQDGRLLACCELQRQDGSAYFGMFAVRPEGQGSGIGNRVLAESERIAAEEWQCREMRMTVIDVRTELIAWYERRGYRRTGIHKPFPYGDERFGIPRRDDLRFEVLSKPLR
ncbi:GNAT family N-acetyltransferase [Dokdonella immobilis]|uniref:Ribosomal protein S18 acetylase RimI n=1 Tax=Dokdonella immobilis TaxID=578942 RepID=A0A1I4XEF4_9GAMM|nr:N-acetyltransferase [Dokdonella immobilis]SFN23659.1 Ribosomal protein S18 acetylase RimI [Dokdonella immobilis]